MLSQSRSTRSVFLALCCASTAILGAAQVQTPPTSAPMPDPAEFALRIEAYGEGSDGQVPGTISRTVPLETSRSRRVSIYAERGACVPQTNAGDAPAGATAAVVWGIETRLVSVENEGGAIVDLRWSRQVSGFGSSPADSFEEHRRVILREEKSRPLDLLNLARAAWPECNRMVIELSLHRVEGQEVANAALRYDLWLIHQEAEGHEVTDRVQSNSRQGAEVEYFFAPLRHRRGGVSMDDANSGTIETWIAGKIRGRVRRDGAIDLTLMSSRTVSAGGFHVGNSGGKHLTVKPGETIEIVLPRPRGQLGPVELADILRGHATAIRVTTTRLR